VPGARSRRQVRRRACEQTRWLPFRPLWRQVSTENLEAITDIAGYRQEFLKLFGFGLPGIDYNADVEPHILMP